MASWCSTSPSCSGVSACLTVNADSWHTGSSINRVGTSRAFLTIYSAGWANHSWKCTCWTDSAGGGSLQWVATCLTDSAGGRIDWCLSIEISSSTLVVTIRKCCIWVYSVLWYKFGTLCVFNTGGTRLNKSIRTDPRAITDQKTLSTIIRVCWFVSTRHTASRAVPWTPWTVITYVTVSLAYWYGAVVFIPTIVRVPQSIPRCHCSRQAVNRKRQYYTDCQDTIGNSNLKHGFVLSGNSLLYIYTVCTGLIDYVGAFIARACRRSYAACLVISHNRANRAVGACRCSWSGSVGIITTSGTHDGWHIWRIGASWTV